MGATLKTVIVIPCFNEEDRLRSQTFLDALSDRPWLHFLFVNDGSTDGTLQVLTKMEEANRARVSILDLPTNSGKAEAVRNGMLAAFGADAKLVGYWDADLATPLEEIDGMRRFILERDAFVVLGSRVLMLGKRIDRKAVRHYLGRVFATAVSVVLDLPVYDTQCGAKLFINNDVTREIFQKPFESRWIFDVEILMRLIIHDRDHGTSIAANKILEYSLEQWRDIAGSKLTKKDFQKAVVELGQIAIQLYRHR